MTINKMNCDKLLIMLPFNTCFVMNQLNGIYRQLGIVGKILKYCFGVLLLKIDGA